IREMCPGPMCTGCLFFMGAWGAIFLGVLGGLFYNQSVGLFDDLPEMSFSDIASMDWDTRKDKYADLYTQNAYNSWVAAVAMLILAILCIFRMCCLAR
ncbi:hypothetical protein PENTCL1PPCAC_17369, partial [Pristionchus entomophagus]